MARQKNTKGGYEMGTKDKIETIDALLASALEADADMRRGVKNLMALPTMEDAKPYFGTKKPKVIPGVMGFRGGEWGLDLVFAGGRAMTIKVKLQKYIAMVENCHRKLGSVVLGNHQAPAEGKPGRGQILGRIVPESSALVVLHGKSGRLIGDSGDVAETIAYYISRERLLFYYLAAKVQIGDSHHLDELIAANEFYKAYDVPLAPVVFDDEEADVA